MAGASLEEDDEITGRRPEVLLACDRAVMTHVVSEQQLARLRTFADFRFSEFDRPSDYVESPPPDTEADRRLISSIGQADALIISIGAPRITGEIMDARPSVRFIGELEGDRFASRIDAEALGSVGSGPSTLPTARRTVSPNGLWR